MQILGGAEPAPEPAAVAENHSEEPKDAFHPRLVGERGSAHAYNVKALRNQEMAIAEQAERAYEQFVGQWRPKPARRRTGAVISAGSS
jgi:hypothetical protein